jgi:hypothetical protein
METMNAQQAVEWGKTLDFPQVWAMMVKLGERIDQTSARVDQTTANIDKMTKELANDRQASQIRIDEILHNMTNDRQASQIRLDEILHNMTNDRQASQSKVDEVLDSLSNDIRGVQANVGGMGNTLGGIMEDMFASKLWDKFEAFGYTFGTTARDKIFYDKKHKKIAEVDAFLENGDFVMAVEVKVRLEVFDINTHLAPTS